VTGATNVPEFKRYFYAGILWIILYTKWPVIGIYLYHAALFSCLLMLSLMDLDRLRCPKWLSGFLLCIFAGLSVAIPTLQPVQFYVHLRTDFSNALPPAVIPIITCFARGTHWLVVHKQYPATYAIKDKLDTLSCSTFPLAGTLVGITLGWQATVTILLFTTVVIAITSAFKKLMAKKFVFH
jgi:leader peptidase (prepilin peptidase)/N-methyltransferase